MDNILNIKFRSDIELEKKLSNLYPYRFEIDGIVVESFEAFIQSLRTPDVKLKQEFYNLTGFLAWKKGQGIDWCSKQEVYWLDNIIERQSDEYTELITKAYDCMFEQCEDYRNRLKESLPYKLEHTIGSIGKKNTLLTRSEFLYQLNRLRNKLTEKKFFNLLDLF